MVALAATLAAAAGLCRARGVGRSSPARRDLRRGRTPSTTTPAKVFPRYSRSHAQVLRVNLYWGGTLGVAKHRPVRGSIRTIRLRLALYDRLVQYAAVRHEGPVLDHRDAALGERRRRARTARRRTSTTSTTSRMPPPPLQRHVRRARTDGRCPRCGSGRHGTSRTTRSSSDRNSVTPAGVGDPERARLREDLQRGLRGVHATLSRTRRSPAA